MSTYNKLFFNNTSWHSHIYKFKFIYINFCNAQILCSDWKTSDQNNTVVQSMLSVNQFKRFNLNSQVYYYVCLTFVISVSKNIENKSKFFVIWHQLNCSQ